MSADELRAAYEAAQTFELAEQDTGGGRRRRRGKSDATLLVESAGMADLWRDPDGNAFVTMQVGDHLENHPIRSQRCRTLLAGDFWRQNDRAVGAQAMEEALRTCEALALSEGACCKTFRRVGHHNGSLYLDLCDDEWRAIEIDANGWRLVDGAPVKFIRSKGMRPLPMPEQGGRIEDLLSFLNIGDDESARMILAWLVAALRSTGPYAILMITGEQGSSKTTTARVCRTLIDPNLATSRAPPRDERDLIAMAANSHVLSFDNLSGLPPWYADALARLATGGGYAARELHTNTDEIVFEGQRPIILNGIPDLAGRADVGDRALTVHLPPIPEDQRRTERAFWSAFDQQHPLLLGALLDAVATAVRELPNVRLPRIPRMADFAEWVTAAESGLGWEPGAFLAAYEANRESVVEMAVEASLLAQVVAAFAHDPPAVSPEPVHALEVWRGTASELLPLLGERVGDAVRNSREWPKNASALGGQLRRISPVLRKRGVEVSWAKGGATSRRLVSIMVAPS